MLKKSTSEFNLIPSMIRKWKDVAVHGIPAILNSDQGCQFTSIEYKTTSKNLQIRQSMEGKNR